MGRYCYPIPVLLDPGNAWVAANVSARPMCQPGQSPHKPCQKSLIVSKCQAISGGVGGKWWGTPHKSL